MGATTLEKRSGNNKINGIRRHQAYYSRSSRVVQQPAHHEAVCAEEREVTRDGTLEAQQLVRQHRQKHNGCLTYPKRSEDQLHGRQPAAKRHGRRRVEG